MPRSERSIAVHRDELMQSWAKGENARRNESARSAWDSEPTACCKRRWGPGGLSTGAERAALCVPNVRAADAAGLRVAGCRLPPAPDRRPAECVPRKACLVGNAAPERGDHGERGGEVPEVRPRSPTGAGRGRRRPQRAGGGLRPGLPSVRRRRGPWTRSYLTSTSSAWINSWSWPG